MVNIVWTFSVRNEARAQFELLYAPAGTWGRLFDRCSRILRVCALNVCVTIRLLLSRLSVRMMSSLGHLELVDER